MMRPSTVFISLLIILLAASACDRRAVYDRFATIEGEQWEWDEVREFDVDLNDTSTLYNVLIQIRHTTDYPMRNLYLFVHLEGPSGQTLTDTINYMLANPDGSWIGKGVGNLRELRYLYRKNTRFPEPGTYTVRLEQGMRVPGLPVTDVGIRVETTPQNR